MKPFEFCRFLLLGLGIVLCGTTIAACAPANPPIEPAAALKPVTLNDGFKAVAGQTIYVSIYSSIFTWDRNRTIDLTATLSVRNTDQSHPVVLSAVNYYDSNGRLIRKYLDQPVALGALASTNFLVNQEDQSGGAGAAFIVEWVAQTAVSAPVVEAVMINTTGNQGISFVSAGRVIKSLN